MIEKIIAEYLAFLLAQLKTDLGWMTTWWMWVAFLVPICFYLLFMVVKWYFLLAPMTVPISVWGVWRVSVPSPVHNHFHGKDSDAAHSKWLKEN